MNSLHLGKICFLCLIVFALFLVIFFSVFKKEKIYSKKNQNLITGKGVPYETILKIAEANNKRFSAPSLLKLSNGDIMLAYDHFYRGVSDDYAQSKISYILSSNGGFEWSKPNDIYKGNLPSLQPSLLRIKDKIACLFLERHTYSDLRILNTISDNQGKIWQQPTNVTVPNSGYHQMNNDRAVFLSNGRVLIPVATCNSILPRSPKDPYVAYTLYSDDKMETWKKGGGSVTIPPNGADEPGLIELLDGRIMMFIRTNMGFVYKSISYDSGETWSAAIPIKTLPSADSPATMKRIPQTGHILIVWNIGNTGTYGRGNLSSMISNNEGESFQNMRVIENNSNYSYAYPTVLFNGNNVIISYWSRNDITIDSSGSGLMDLKLKIFPYKWFYEKSGNE